MQCSEDVHEANGLGILRPELPDPASVPWRYLGVRSTFEETLSRLETVLSHLSTLNLKVKPEKCQLFHKKVSYLRYVVTCEGTSPDCEKVQAVSSGQGQRHYIISVGFLVCQAIIEDSWKDMLSLLVSFSTYSRVREVGRKGRKSREEQIPQVMGVSGTNGIHRVKRLFSSWSRRSQMRRCWD